MRWPVLWALLLFPAAGTLAQGCPASCQCSQPRTVFCVSRRSHAVPQGLPPDTASLYVFENGIRALSEDSFAGLPALQLLDLSQNQLSTLPRDVFQPLGGLSNLDLSANRLGEITNETFRGLRGLERLYLHRNRIRLIHPQAFDSLESLLELKLQDNQLRALPPLRLPTLLLLDVSRNAIAALEPDAFHVGRLESLKIAGLHLDRLDGELLRKLRSLHELDCSDNRLSSVPAALKELRGLTKLSLAGNARIAQLQPGDLRELPDLQELDISSLNLNHLPEDFFGAFPRLKALTAAENPFNCVCQMSWLVRWLSSGRAALQRPEETRCHFPPKNAGRLLQHLEYADLGCPTTTAAATAAWKATSPRLTTPAPSSGPPEPGTASPTPGPDGSTLMPVTTPEGRRPSPEARLCPPYTCLNGGMCQWDAQHRLACICPLGFSGTFCEARAPAATVPAATPLPPTQPQQIAIKHVGGTSLRVDLRNYVESQSRLKGIRLTYSNLSGPDKRPVTLNLPATLAEYTVRELRPNSSYHICVGPLGDRALVEEDFCLEARTLQLTHQQHAPVTQGRHPNLTLILVPAITAALLVAVAVAAVSYYVRRRRRQQGKTRPTTGIGSGPLELEGVKACLGNGDLVGPGAKLPGKTAALSALECEVPLVQPQHTSASTPRAPRPPYF